MADDFTRLRVFVSTVTDREFYRGCPTIDVFAELAYWCQAVARSERAARERRRVIGTYERCRDRRTGINRSRAETPPKR
jgi:hypothetical protein